MRTFLALFVLASSCASAGAAGVVTGKPKFYLAGEIGEEIVPYLTEYLTENQDAEVVLSTSGGSRQASDAISELITKHGNVRCVVRDKAMSGGFGILQACRLRVMRQTAVIGTHEPRMVIPQAVERVLAGAVLEALNSASKDWNARCRARLRISAAEYESKVKGKDWVMTAHEALKVGAVDQVIP